MNKKSFWVTSVVIFLVIIVLDMIINNVILKGAYMATAGLWRPEADIMRLMPLSFLVYAVMALLFTFIYAKGCEGKPSRIGEGLRFGFVIGLFTSLPMALMCYITMPITTGLAWGWFLTGMGENLILGALVGLLYKKA